MVGGWRQRYGQIDGGLGCRSEGEICNESADY